MDSVSPARRAQLVAMVQALLTVKQSSSFFDLDKFRQIHNHIDLLFESDPQWYAPLLTSKGLAVFAQLLDWSPAIASTFQKRASPLHLMQLCLSLQTITKDSPDQVPHARKLLSPLSQPLLQAIQHYIHPHQAESLTELQASLPVPPPAMPQSNAPPAALPLLFPTLDTSQFAPQFDWFMYLLTQYCPINHDDYNEKLTDLLNTTTEPNSLDQLLIHNNLLNSYPEYLQYKLPLILPHLDSTQQPQSEDQCQQPQQHPSQPLLFPYSPTTHPIFHPIPSKDDFTTLLTNPTSDFALYYVYTFVLVQHLDSPKIHQPLEDRMGRLASLRGTNKPTLPLSFQFQALLHNYRVWHFGNSNMATNTDQPQSNPLQSSQPLHSPHLSLPNFLAQPAALLQLTLVPALSKDFQPLQLGDCPKERFKTIIPKLNDLTQTQSLLFLHIIEHCFPSKPTQDEILEQVAAILLPLARGPNVGLSYTLYQRGSTTLHQHAYSIILKQLHGEERIPSTTVDSIVEWFLSSPFPSYRWGSISWGDLAKHITLCVHAGFFLPLPTPPLRLNDTTPPGSAQLYHKLTTLRSVLHAFLVRLTGLISYFPQSTRQRCEHH
jgi:hypothetical protein